MKTSILAQLTIPVLMAGATHAAVIFGENFDGATLRPQVDETTALTGNTWNTPADSGLGWTRGADNLLTPGRVTEWAGWSVATTEFWVAADDQSRSLVFPVSGTNVVAIADSDEYDDALGATIEDEYNVFLRSPAIALGGYDTSSLQLSFDSSFRSEEDETSVFSVIFDGVSAATINISDNGENPAANLVFDAAALNVPVGASSLTIEFAHEKADNNWWWAIDNVMVTGNLIPEPSTSAMILLAGFALIGRRRR